MDFAGVHAPGGLGDVFLWVGGHHLRGHDLLGGGACRLGVFLAVAECHLLRRARPRQLLDLLLPEAPDSEPGLELTVLQG
jgi:hypothetical protein